MILIMITVGESCSGAFGWDNSPVFFSFTSLMGKDTLDELWLALRAQKIHWVQVDLTLSPLKLILNILRFQNCSMSSLISSLLGQG